MRITDKDLKNRISILNDLMGFKANYGKDNHFGLDYAYGGVMLVFIYASTGESNVSNRGTKKEIYNYINAMIISVDYYKNRVKYKKK